MELTTKQAAAYLQTQDNVLILTHIRPDGDTIGSAAALCRTLRGIDKQAYLLPNDGITTTYAPYAEGLWASADFAPDCVVSVDIAALSLFPDNAKNYQQHVDLAVDHHPSQEFFAARTCLGADRAACGELVFDICRELAPLSREVALALYVAVSTDCGGFQYGNTTADTHRVAAQLMELVDVKDVNKQLFRTKSLVRLKMEARMVEEMETCSDGRIVVMSIPLSMRREMNATEADVEELSSLPSQVAGAQCGITLRELRPGVVKVSVRSTPEVDACAVCRKLGGGGHHAAAGATVEGEMEQVKAAVLQAVRQVTEE